MYKFCYHLLFSLVCLLLGLQTASAQVLINEYSAANHTQFTDTYSGYEDWIELYNTTAVAVDISNWGLTDNPDKLAKWRFKAGTTIAANGFARIWCSGRDTTLGTHFHANFKLTQTKGTPEKITLTDPANLIVDQIEVKKTARHQSRCRATDGGTPWRICFSPSPRTSNNGKPMFDRYLDRPSVDKDAGFYADSVTVTLTTDIPGAIIHYTLDGNEPLQASAQYTEPIKITQTTVLKARVYANDSTSLPSFIVFNTYFINVNHTLPVVSIAADQLLTLANGNQGLRPRGSLEYFGTDKLRKDKEYGELNSHGQDSWANDQRSLDWISRDEFGYSDAIDVKIFQGSDRDKFQRMIFRASGDDNYPAGNRQTNEGCAHMRDDYVQVLADLGGMHLDTRRTERCIVYLNGEYWGVYSFREKIDDPDYMQEYYNQDDKFKLQMVLTWGDTWAEFGGAKAISDWKALRSFIFNNNMADSSNYAYVDGQMDNTSLIDYFLINTTAVSSDWLNYNTGWWRGLKPDGEHKKWAYILWDNDATFAFYINYTGVPDTSPYAKPCDIDSFDTQFGSPDPEDHIRILNKMRTNPQFNQLYLSRHADMHNTVFSCASMLHVLDSMAAVIEPEMDMHANRWFGTYAGWQTNLARMRHFIERRCELLDEGLITCDSVLSGPHAIHFRTEPPGLGSIKVNTLPANPQPWTGNYYKGMANLLEATPKPASGYIFSHWEGKNTAFTLDSTQALVSAAFSAPDTVIAHFKLFSSASEAERTLVATAWPTIFTDDVQLAVQTDASAPISVIMFDLMGKQVLNKQLGTTSYFNGKLQLPADLHTGVYLLRIQSGNAVRTVKLIKS